MSQNKSIDTIRGVVKGLTESPDKLAHDVADLMQRNLEMLEKRI
ncbi:hypothetical protein [Alicyclobacillus suci]|nr:hypothetical protein [Alicyclobacillus suci]